MNESMRFDATKLDSGQLLFRQIDRILQTTAKEYADIEMFLLSLYCEIEGLRNLMVEEMFNPNEKNKLEKLRKDKEAAQRKVYSDRKDSIREIFRVHMEYFNHCIQVLARNGYIYRKEVTGDDEEPRKQV